jgi:hypothetical protein
VDYARISGRLILASGDTRIFLDDKDLSSVLGQFMGDCCPHNSGPYNRGFDNFHWFRLFSTLIPKFPEGFYFDSTNGMPIPALWLIVHWHEIAQQFEMRRPTQGRETPLELYPSSSLLQVIMDGTGNVKVQADVFREDYFAKSRRSIGVSK